MCVITALGCLSGELRRVAERHLGLIADQRYNFAGAADLERFIRGAGFANVRLKTISHKVHFDDGGHYVRLNSVAFVGLSAAGKQMDEQQRRQAVDAIVTDSAAVLRSTGSTVDFDVSMNVAMGRR
jgi:hypothetical protein